MDLFEEAVQNYLCGRPERFVHPQFTIPYADLQGGSCPDFVVLDFADRTVYVAEVTVASDTKNVWDRVVERETRWFKPLREHFSQNIFSHAFEKWDYHVTLFVRKEQFDKVRERTAQLSDVSVLSLDDVVFSWRWNWQPDGLPANPLREKDKHRS